MSEITPIVCPTVACGAVATVKYWLSKTRGTTGGWFEYECDIHARIREAHKVPVSRLPGVRLVATFRHERGFSGPEGRVIQDPAEALLVDMQAAFPGAHISEPGEIASIEPTTSSKSHPCKYCGKDTFLTLFCERKECLESYLKDETEGQNMEFIELHRDSELSPKSNLPDVTITRSSLTNIGWGYEGSGPMELAKRMIKATSDKTDDEINDGRLYVDLMRSLIQHLPRFGNTDADGHHCAETDQAAIVHYNKGEWKSYDSLPLDDSLWANLGITPKIGYIYIRTKDMKDWIQSQEAK